jgi:hypothetical protein
MEQQPQVASRSFGVTTSVGVAHKLEAPFRLGSARRELGHRGVAEVAAADQPFELQQTIAATQRLLTEPTSAWPVTG